MSRLVKSTYCTVLLALLLLISCKKKDDTQATADHPVPSIILNVPPIYPSDPLYFKLQSIGGWVYIEGGLNGIVVYRKSYEEFVALERTSSQLPNNPKARAIVQRDNFFLKDTISGSEWQIIDGGVTKGPAKWGLRRYGTLFDGNKLLIQN